MSASKQANIDNLRNLIVEGTPLDEKHPGAVNLAPFEMKRFKDVMRMRDNRDLNPDEKCDLTFLQ